MTRGGCHEAWIDLDPAILNPRGPLISRPCRNSTQLEKNCSNIGHPRIRTTSCDGCSSSASRATAGSVVTSRSNLTSQLFEPCSKATKTGEHGKLLGSRARSCSTVFSKAFPARFPQERVCTLQKKPRWLYTTLHPPCPTSNTSKPRG